MDKTKTKCKGKWKEHGELEIINGRNEAGACWTHKKCKRCGRYVYTEITKHNDVNYKPTGYMVLSLDERMKLATHYKLPHTEPSATVRVGRVEGKYFFDLYIALHKAEAKRLGLIEYYEKK